MASKFWIGAMALVSSMTSATSAGPSLIPMAVHNGKQFTVTATVGGQPRTFLFDTGEGTTMIGPEVARATGCEPWGNVVAFRMLGERLDTKRCDGTAFTIAGRRYRAFSTIVYDLDEIAQDGGRLAGAIGLDLFDGKVVTLRFKARRIEVADTVPPDARRGQEVPIRLARFSEGGIDVNIGVRTPKGLAWMELDSANAGPTIFVAPAIAPTLGLRADNKEPQPVRAEIAPGVMFVGQARVFPGMIIDGNIGMQFLNAWDLTLDLKSGRGWVAPAARP
jgi:hypothetical protein